MCCDFDTRNLRSSSNLDTVIEQIPSKVELVVVPILATTEV